jgi:hypothetical protein
VKFMLVMYMNPELFESLSEDEKNAVYQGHDDFQKVVNESGEMVETKALADPPASATVRVRNGAASTTDGPYLEAKEFFCGYYVVDVASKERAAEVAALIPDAKHTAVEVREIVHDSGPA